MIGRAIQAISPNVICLDRRHDLTESREVVKAFETILPRPTQIIHLAAKVGGLKANMSSPANFFTDNIKINTNVIDAAYRFGVPKLVCFLSTCIFPDPCRLPLEPKDIHDGPPHPSNYGYAYAKRMLAVQCQAYNQQYGTSYIPVIPCNMYGPHDSFNLETGHAVPNLIHKIWLAKKSGINVTLWGTGNPRREFLYSEDVAKLCFEVLDKYTSTEPLIFSPGIEHSISELAFCIKKAINFTGMIDFDSTKPDGQFRKPSDNTPLRALLPNFKFTPLADGIQKTVDWFAKAWPNVRL